MSSSNLPWFYSESRKAQLFKDIDDARQADRITEQQRESLESLIAPAPDANIGLRVDRLTRGDGGLMNAELAGALLISDSMGIAPELYLCTPLHGVERFDSRPELIVEWTARYGQQGGDPERFEYERLEGDFFASSKLAIVDQRVQARERFTECLLRLPSLRTALGQALQQRIDAQMPDKAIDVFSHLTLIKALDTATQVGATLGSRTLIEAAMRSFVGTPLAAGLHQVWLDEEGREVAADQAQPWQQAMDGVSDSVGTVFENLLTDYWSELAVDGMTHRELACQVFTERLRLHLLDARHEGQLTASEYAALKMLCSAGEEWAQVLKVSRLSVAIGTEEPIKLAGIFLIDFRLEPLPGVFLYCSKFGLRRYATIGVVAEHFAGIEGRIQLVEYTSLNDHALLRSLGHQHLHLRLDGVVSTPMLNIVDSIIAVQKRDLAAVLKQSFSSVAEVALCIGKALNISHLLDPGVSVGRAAYRWNEAMASSERKWSEFSSPSRISELSIQVGKDTSPEPLLPWTLYLNEARNRVDTLFHARPSLADHAGKLLDRYFSILSHDAVDARRMWFRDEDNRVVSLTVLLVERVTGHRQAKVPQDCEVYVDAPDSAYPQYLSWLTPDVLDHVLNRAQQAFTPHYMRQIRAFRSGQLRIVDSRVIGANASGLIREGLLRLELNLQRNSGQVSDLGLDMLQQILDRPAFRQRAMFGFGATEVSVPVLVYDSSQPAVPLTNVMVLHQPLNGSCKPVQWSSILGLRELPSVTELLLDLNARLTYPGSRERWLKLIAEPDRDNVRRFLKQSENPRLEINLARIEGHCVEHLDFAERQRQCQAVEAAYRRALKLRADAGLVEKVLTTSELDDKARSVIDMLSGAVELTLLSGSIPDWLKEASVHDLLLFRQLLVCFSQLFNSRKTIPTVSSLAEFAAQQLRERLHQDFPVVQLDPERISIDLHRDAGVLLSPGNLPSGIPSSSNIVSESLTLYAINRFSTLQDGFITLSSRDATVLPASLDVAYVQALVRELNVGAGYEQYLKQEFSNTAPEYAERLAQFVEQAPCAFLLMAYRLKLQKLLSPTAYDFIENVISMPDSLARLPCNGLTINCSPLKLVCAEGYAADLVTGVYLISPADQAEGPWILHATADPEFFLKEYVSQSAFLTDLCTSEKLQAMVLERLNPDVRFVYERGGFLQPHLSWTSGGFEGLADARPGPVQLRVEPVQENFLHCLFQASHQVMLLIARKNSVTTAQADRAGSHYLMTLSTQQILTLLPGRVGGLIGLWQGQGLLRASLESASDDHWGKATAEFTAALAVLISSRELLEDAAFRSGEGASSRDDQAAPRWHDPQLQVDLSAHLQAYEIHDVSLNSLQRDDALNVFKDPVSLKQYAGVLGRVFEVKRGLNGWCMVAGAKEGPRIKLDSSNRWIINTELGTRRDGGALTRLRSAQTNMDVNDILIVEARGIPEIQQQFPLKARQIGEAHEQALQYLENALDNLTITSPDTELDPRTATIIKDFFGVRSLGNVSVLPIKRALFDIYVHMLDASFSPLSSERYVVGTNKLGYEQATAFNFANDPLRRIYMSERFFTAPYVRLKPTHLRQGAFNIGTHFRAAILIHEVSHIVGDTHDIAYVDSSVPYLDLLEDVGEYRARIKSEHRKAQQKLSHLTQHDELFRMEEDDMWRDLKTADGDGKRAVLRIAGTDTLESARHKFMHNVKVRSEIILSNADSVALLTTLLGRERFLPAPALE